ncbi:MAG: ribosome small subunit-dependent GTPase A, partial [Kangiellaceae bacterium]|nr:ribosome small subunit-dependent GTPase A [Kangiellaceae bacterium]
QSGVGKSTLINQIMPGVNAATGEVSENSRLGTHTTTASRLYFIPNGGHIIDSPGVREFGLSHIEASQIIEGMIDLKQFDGQCKFRNCSHMNEKGCAIGLAVKEHKVHQQRFNNYQKIVSQIEQASR